MKRFIIVLGLLCLGILPLQALPAEEASLVPEVKVILKGLEEVTLSIVNLTECRHSVTVERYDRAEKLISFSTEEIIPGRRLDLDYEPKPAILIYLGPSKKSAYGYTPNIGPLPLIGLKNTISLKSELPLRVELEMFRDGMIYKEEKEVKPGEYMFGQGFVQFPTELVDKTIIITRE